ncbi:MAG TPA: sigma-70 family RNA polymerase sigma factor [Chloroflexota bacterium]|nr:sigma-70 family RNA polymerase sigma factor [Chloroflexota bacterium]
MDLDPATLEPSLRAAQRGDVAAFNQLVGIFQRQVYNVCLRTLGHSEDAADATQEAFLSAFRGLKTFRGPASGFRPWLLRVAVNACYDQLRRRQRRPADSLDALGDPADELALAERLADPAPGPERQAMNSETARQIQQALDLLVPEQRMAVVLCDVQGLSYDEAAEAMGVELGTIKSRLSRARARLRELLVEKELLSPSARLPQRNP